MWCWHTVSFELANTLPQNVLCGAVSVPVCCESGSQGVHSMKRCGSCTRAGDVKSQREKLSPLPPFKQLGLVMVVLLRPSPQIKKPKQDADCSECFK